MRLLNLTLRNIELDTGSPVEKTNQSNSSYSGLLRPRLGWGTQYS